jgi:hypothetical protein
MNVGKVRLATVAKRLRRHDLATSGLTFGPHISAASDVLLGLAST